MSGDKSLMLDAHAHFYRYFDISDFINSAYANFNKTAQSLCLGGQFVGVLFLTESPSESGFGRLYEQYNTEDSELTGRWSVCDTQESTSVALRADGGRCLVVIAGRQIVAREELEVLAVGTRRRFDNGRPVSELIRTIARAGALPIIPWGVGKWLGVRGQVVESLIRSSELPSFFLGDSANRPSFWPLPAHFDQAESRGIRNLPGSDPLPYPEEVQKIGSFGVALNSSLDLRKPAQDLKRTLLDPSTTLHQFGEGETTLRFVRNQLKMQLRKLTQ